MGAVAGPSGLVRVVLPHYQTDELAQLLAWEHAGARRDAGPFEALVRLCQDYFSGRLADFARVPCDLPAEQSFAGMVLRACRQIAYGRTTTYGELAKQIGRPEAARAVAAALAKNPIPLVVPCHRVTYSDGGLGGFSAPGGVEVKRRMLALEARAGGQQ
jgi:methylated-DNA-[protein]-cysteine S-methyltransferase